MPTPPKPPPAPPPADPAPTDPPADPADDDPRSMLKGIVREVLDEFAADQLANPKRTKPFDPLRALLGIKD